MKMLKLSVKMKRYEMLDGSKKHLVQQVGDGSIIKRFEKTLAPTRPNDVVCPHFLELKWAYGCPYNCSWCYLKGTLRLLPTKTRPVIKNYDRIRSAVRAFFNNCNGPGEIINTGELADSLMGEHNNPPFSKFIIILFETQNTHKVLFLTKSNNVKNLMDVNPHNRAIISFSLNADPVAKRWEKRAPTVKDRIMAAQKVYDAGYETRIRIDPIVPIENWKTHYADLIHEIFSSFIPERITLGSLRGLQSTINEAADKSWVKYLFENSNWGKRISFETRYSMYSKIINVLKEKYSYSNIALCKETMIMWEKLGMDRMKCKCNCVW